ncbi:MAG: V-type ATP synthase subunit D [Planctomycetaceae bacterium]
MTLALNKTTLKQQRDQARTYHQFLPSLELKRQQLLAALKTARQQKESVDQQIAELTQSVQELLPLLGSSTIATRNVASLVRVQSIRIVEENIVGNALPVVKEVLFDVVPYSKLVTPFWVDGLIEKLQTMATLRIHQQVAEERFQRLDVAARRITQRVNLFEKVLIPEAEHNIRRIVIFLSDQERAAVVRSKIAKSKEQTCPLSDSKN